MPVCRSTVDRINFSAGVERTKIGLFSDSPKRYVDFVNEHSSSNFSLLVSASWARDTRDSALWLTKGLGKQSRR